jgi:hypothetical protein
MMKEIFTAIAISVLAISLLITVNSDIVRADSDDFIRFLDSGVTVFSPLNTTYHSQTPILNVTLYGAGNFGSIDPEISVNYSIDDMYTGSVYLRSNGEMHFITNAIGVAALPELPSGSHCLKIYLYGWNQRSYEPRYLSYTNTIYFSIVDAKATPAPIPSPSPTASPTPVPISSSEPTNPTSPTPLPSEEPQPIESELILGVAVTVAVVVIGLVFLLYLIKRK